MSLDSFKTELKDIIRAESEKSFIKAMSTKFNGDPSKHVDEMAKNFADEMAKILPDTMATSIDKHIKNVFTSLSTSEEETDSSSRDSG